MSQAEETAKWLKQFQDNVKISLEAATKVVNNSVYDLYRVLYDTSVVGKPETWKSKPPANYTPGTLKEGWRISFSGLRDAGGKFASASAITNSHGMAVTLDGGSKTAYIFNNTPYLERIEYQGWSKQAPNGFVRIAVMQFTTIVEGNAAKFRIK